MDQVILKVHVNLGNWAKMSSLLTIARRFFVQGLLLGLEHFLIFLTIT